MTVLAARPNVLTNPPHATITIRMCTMARRTGEAIGSVAGDLAHWCSRVVPPDGATLIAQRHS